eukprot:3717477-Pleurochrysis_carterae.AAC.1
MALFPVASLGPSRCSPMCKPPLVLVLPLLLAASALPVEQMGELLSSLSLAQKHAECPICAPLPRARGDGVGR